MNSLGETVVGLFLTHEIIFCIIYIYIYIVNFSVLLPDLKVFMEEAFGKLFMLIFSSQSSPLPLLPELTTPRKATADLFWLNSNTSTFKYSTVLSTFGVNLEVPHPNAIAISQFLWGNIDLPSAFVCIECDGCRNSKVSIRKLNGMAGMLSTTLFLV